MTMLQAEFLEFVHFSLCLAWFVTCVAQAIILKRFLPTVSHVSTSGCGLLMASTFLLLLLSASAEALPILCLRCARWERERDTERERQRERERRKWRYLSSAEIGDEFALFLAKNLNLFLGLPSWMALSSYFPLPNTLHSSKQFAFFIPSVKWRDRGSKHRNKRSNFRLHRPSSHWKNESN